jgi:preprotein translocase subunit SecA
MSRAIAALRPGASLGAYPERQVPRQASAALRSAVRYPQTAADLRPAALRRFVTRVEEEGKPLTDLSVHALKARLAEFRARLLREGFTARAVAPIFALIRELAQRTVGQRHFDVQLMGGWVILNGAIAEMQTGEGKSLTATLPACAAALAGIPVHIVTVNDYLVERDADHFAPLYKALGLSVGAIGEQMDTTQRRDIYHRHIVYCSNKQLVFDYLRDRLTLAGGHASRSLAIQQMLRRGMSAEKLLMRGLCFAIVDEADSVLIDDARTPLIISTAGNAGLQQSFFREALDLAKTLVAGTDYCVDRDHQRVWLTDGGRQRLTSHRTCFPPPWSGRLQKEYLITQALSALHLYERDRQYLVADGKVVIIDTSTGRAMPDRQWEHGLHQLIETKEGVNLSVPNKSLAKLSFQQFFSRYLLLAGMTGTAYEVRRELRQAFGLTVVNIPTRRPSRRQCLPLKVYVNEAARWHAMISEIRGLATSGCALLIGTTTVEQSERMSAQLKQLGLRHQVLNARLLQLEAQIVATAGRAGCITVATNMAGRGTDIKLGPGVEERGGLHVISTEPNVAARIDRQLAGRAARQGDSGSYQPYASLSDEILKQNLPRWIRALLTGVASADGRLPTWLGCYLVRRAQLCIERRHAAERRRLRLLDKQAETLLAFSGPLE